MIRLLPLTLLLLPCLLLAPATSRAQEHSQPSPR